MMEFIKNINPLILDTIVVSLFVLIIFFGVIKGIKKVSINFGIFAAALFLGFCPYTNALKEIIATKVLNLPEWVPAGSSSMYKLGAVMFTGFLSALVLFLLFYLVAHSVYTLIELIIKKKRKTLPLPKSKAGRVFAGIITFLYQGLALVVLMLIMNNNLVGMNEAFNKSTVTKFIVNQSDKLARKIDDKLPEKIVIKTLKGDILYKVEEEIVDEYEYLEEKAGVILMDKEYLTILDDTKLSEDEIRLMAKERLADLSHLTMFVNEMDTFGNIRVSFEKVTEEWLTTMHRVINNRNIGKIELSMNEYGEIRKSFVDYKLPERLIQMYEEIAVGK